MRLFCNNCNAKIIDNYCKCGDARAIVVAHLQRQLIHLLREDVSSNAIALATQQMNFNHQGLSLPPAKHNPEVSRLRAEILALNPKACIFETWGGAMPPKIERRDHDFSNKPEREA